MPAFWRVWNHLGRYRPYSDTRQFQVHPVHLDGRNRERGPSTKEDIRLSDIVASKPTAARSGIIQYDFGKKCAKDQLSVDIE
jgi:hypothetical protein